jgi:hypothetical protein
LARNCEITGVLVLIALDMAGYENDDFADLEELKVLQLEGVDNKGRQIARIVGKFLPGTHLNEPILPPLSLKNL